MSVRTVFAAFRLVILGVLIAGCSGTAKSTTEHSELTTPGTSVSWLKVSPEQSAPSSVVSLDMACLDDFGAVQSPVLDVGSLHGNPEGHQPWHLVGTATVRPDAAPGRYRVSATCGGSELSTDFTVIAGPFR
jgi:hypothetical protein